jgi:hypothetical protein
MHRIPAGTILYRAALTLEEHLTPRYCPDTGKTGVYFAIGSPYLSETMTIEYDHDLIVGVYQLTKTIRVREGKYAFRKQKKKNISHIEFGLSAVNEQMQRAPPGSAELFLVERHLQSVVYRGSYTITVDEAIEKWQKPSEYLNID